MLATGRRHCGGVALGPGDGGNEHLLRQNISTNNSLKNLVVHLFVSPVRANIVSSILARLIISRLFECKTPDFTTFFIYSI